MLIDKVTIHIKAGHGGDGLVSFHRERFVPKGGPDGGDGGDGGDIVIRVRADMGTLLDYKYQASFAAEDGRRGGSNRRHGRRGRDCLIPVPAGTVVRDANSGVMLADLLQPQDEIVIARGGKGGRGSAFFATPTRQAPRFAEQGLPGEERELVLQLKLLADVGIIGFPNVGKSSLLARLSAAQPKIADYPFTTLQPNLGVVYGPDEARFVMADLPGLIEGAHTGAGLGHQFLRHLERCRLLLHLLEPWPPDERDPVNDYLALNEELRLFDPRLEKLPHIVAVNKIDLAPDADEAPASASASGLWQRFLQIREQLKSRSQVEARPISALTGHGLRALVCELVRALERAKQLPSPFADEQAHPEALVAPHRPLRVQQIGEGVFGVEGTGVEELIARTNLRNEAALRYLHMQLEKQGVLQALERAGAHHGDVVRIGDLELDYLLAPEEED